ncbi:hypothetical protein SAMN04488490_0509 [Marinobacter sp. LV10R510-11A]|uniref:hypothetical protein n=1 Tax=Marinobacter sp. LV10R510-11A TaxID=1415568 RepID=UPI000BB8FCA3|nr:hypothetical protein [Marinobacter sp. LV10R510-11A]SOB74963.1 hypothetical protein SAMN04488490_0509 [Marinobacter sp. LV10R510-11A]
MDAGLHESMTDMSARFTMCAIGAGILALISLWMWDSNIAKATFWISLPILPFFDQKLRKPWAIMVFCGAIVFALALYMADYKF